MDDIQNIKIQRLQQHLPLIRKLAGWSATDLGEKIGVSKQTISSIETKPDYRMSPTQYLAIRYVIDEEYKNNKVAAKELKNTVDLLVDKGVELSDEEYQKVEDAAKTVSEAASQGVKGDGLKTLAKMVFTLIGAATILGIMADDEF